MNSRTILTVVVIAIVCVGAIFSYWLHVRHLEVRFLSPFATSTVVVITPAAPPSSPLRPAIATSTLSKFEFSYPTAEAYLIDRVGAEGVVCDGVIGIDFSDLATTRSAKVFIATSPSTACQRFNPDAKILADYEKGYSTQDWADVIHSQEKVTIHGIPMLRQIYSHGYWKTNFGDSADNKVLGTTDEGGADHQLRYVFFDENKFVIVTGPEPYLDQITYSITLRK